SREKSARSGARRRCGHPSRVVCAGRGQSERQPRKSGFVKSNFLSERSFLDGRFGGPARRARAREQSSASSASVRHPDGGATHVRAAVDGGGGLPRPALMKVTPESVIHLARTANCVPFACLG